HVGWDKTVELGHDRVRDRGVVPAADVLVAPGHRAELRRGELLRSSDSSRDRDRASVAIDQTEFGTARRRELEYAEPRRDRADRRYDEPRAIAQPPRRRIRGLRMERFGEHEGDAAARADPVLYEHLRLE